MDVNSYAVIGTTRNRQRELNATIDSLIAQTIPPTQIMFFDDGSTIPAVYHNQRVTILRREDEGYDIRRVVVNWNLLLKRIDRNVEFLMITADDCIYPPKYAEEIMKRMNVQQISVASGNRGIHASPDGWKAPEGSGRFIKMSFLREVSFQFPERAGYEPWIFLEALKRGYKVASYQDIRYQHLAEFGKEHGFVEWAGMAHTLGYDFLFFTSRCLKNLVTGDVPVRATIKMYTKYIWLFFKYPTNPFYTKFPQDFRAFVRHFQRQRLKKYFRRFP
jgi:glycosyltransferase involved in cell wall biosynthesis